MAEITPEEARAAIEKLKDVKQTVIARKMGASPPVLSRWLNGERSAPPGKLAEAVAVARRIARAIDAA